MRRTNASLEHKERDSTKKAKAAFLTQFREGWSILFCSSNASVNRSTVWRWRQVDQPFDKLYREAEQDGIDIYRDLAHVEAKKGNVAAIGLVLKMKGALPGDLNANESVDVAIGAAFTVEDLAQRAIDRGYVSTPKALKEIDGTDIVKVT